MLLRFIRAKVASMVWLSFHLFHVMVVCYNVICCIPLLHGLNGRYSSLVPRAQLERAVRTVNADERYTLFKERLQGRWIRNESLGFPISTCMSLTVGPCGNTRGLVNLVLLDLRTYS